MRTVILDGTSNDGSYSAGDLSQQVGEQFKADLEQLNYQVDLFRLGEIKIADCLGDFKCWVKTPGICAIDDANREIAQAVAQSELLVFITPVTFGGYSSHLKKAVDHLIQNLSPNFQKMQGETHHQKRYARYPGLIGIGLLPAEDPQAERLFQSLLYRNALNFHAPYLASAFIYQRQLQADLGLSGLAFSSGLLAQAASPAGLGPPPGGTPGLLEVASGERWVAQEKRALLLVGSPRGPKSTSASLGGYLCDRLADSGWEIETVDLVPALRKAARFQELLADMERASLVVLSSPLYVDSFPAPVIRALERFAEHRQVTVPRRGQGLSVLLNCGFPEAAHNATALQIARRFACESGFTWAGGLAMGGGESIHGKPLAELGGMASNIRRSLELAAKALGKGDPLPAEAVVLMAEPLLPPWMYRLFGGYGWRQQARGYGAQRRLGARPYK